MYGATQPFPQIINEVPLTWAQGRSAVSPHVGAAALSVLGVVAARSISGVEVELATERQADVIHFQLPRELRVESVSDCPEGSQHRGGAEVALGVCGQNPDATQGGTCREFLKPQPPQ